MSYFEQKLQLDTSKTTWDRFKYFTEISRGKSVLHIGFVDYPITNASQNMHLMIDKVCKSMVGVDPNYETYASVKPQLKNQEMYGSLDQVISQHFDIVIVPEVIEHVGNIQAFLEELETLSFIRLYISAPNAFDLKGNGRFNSTTGIWTENVHPDHNCWFSPYTLNNTVTKYTNLKSVSILTLKWGSVVGIYEK